MSGMLSFELHGTGKAHVLALHDWHGDRTNYDAVRPYLNTDEFTYAFVDLRGYGGSRALPGRFTLDECASDCVRVMDHLGWQRLHVIGHSMSGMLAQRLMVDAEARIASAVVVCPTSAAGLQVDAATYEFFASTTHDDERFRKLVRYMSGGLSGGWEAFKLRQSRSRVNPACRRSYLDMMVQNRFVNDVQGKPLPLLVMIGEYDPGLDEAEMKRTYLRWHPNAQLVRLTGCGHYPMQECPPRFVTVVEDFLRQQSG